MKVRIMNTNNIRTSSYNNGIAPFRCFLLKLTALIAVLTLIGCDTIISDTTAPAEVGSINAVAGNRQVVLTWKDPADSDFAFVIITYPSRPTPYVVAKGTQTRTITGLINDTSYTFTVKTVDTTGNKSSGRIKIATPTNPTAQVAAPTASPNAGQVTAGTQVTLSTTTSGAIIHCTTDGSTPNATSAPYSTPIIVTSAMTIKAIAVKSGMNDSAVLSAAYTLGAADPRETAIPLTSNIEVYSSIAMDEEKWYSFTAEPGTAYNIIWQDAKDYFAGKPYTAVVTVTAYAGTSDTALSGFLAHSYNTHTLTILDQSGTIYLRVKGDPWWSEGTFVIKYAPTASEPGDLRETVIPLSDATWTDDSIAEGGEKWYSFMAAPGTVYGVSWEDCWEQAASSSYTANVSVTAYAGTSTTALPAFLEVNNGYITPKTISDQSGTIYLKVKGSPITGGTFAIKYGIFPGAFYTDMTAAASGYTNMRADTWAQGALAIGGAQWFRFTATDGKFTSGWESRQYIHAEFGTLADLYVQLYDSDGNPVGTQANLVGNTRFIYRTVTIGNVYYVRVWTTRSGMYKLAFNTSDTAPL
ncbi:hypothetical protein FACS189450_08680 [Spirochaetia bacterium]|nr:hypothetical protein FACS189450_08680 [Spirochaetia bacterium]